MKKTMYYLLVIMIAALVFFIVKKNMKVTYKTISEKGVTFEVPKNYVTSTLDEWRVFSEKSSVFHIAVASIEMSEDRSIDEVMPNFKDILIYGYLEDEGHKFTIPFGKNISNIILTDYSIERINGIEVGSVVISYDQKRRNQTHRMSGRFSYLMNEDHCILIVFSSQRNVEEKYQAIVDHVVNSIKIQ